MPNYRVNEHGEIVCVDDYIARAPDRTLPGDDDWEEDERGRRVEPEPEPEPESGPTEEAFRNPNPPAPKIDPDAVDEDFKLRIVDTAERMEPDKDRIRNFLAAEGVSHQQLSAWRRSAESGPLADYRNRNYEL